MIQLAAAMQNMQKQRENNLIYFPFFDYNI